MKTEEFKFNILVYDSIDELNSEDASLLTEARRKLHNLHMPLIQNLG